MPFLFVVPRKEVTRVAVKNWGRQVPGVIKTGCQVLIQLLWPAFFDVISYPNSPSVSLLLIHLRF